MRNIAWLIIAVFVFSPAIGYSAEEYDLSERNPSMYTVEMIAKQYVADNYDCDVDDLTTAHVVEGKSGAIVEVVDDYQTITVHLNKKNFGDDWTVTSVELPPDGLD
ncbi:MAG: hypothetical protein HQ558_02265 [Candidatus Omnitrophica bacterium]|nr:hypothetical protein [Candidatus Omnitrophota bacterium]